MTKIKRVFLSLLPLLALSSCFALSSCDNDEGSTGQNQSPITNKTLFVLNDSNAGSYFNVDVVNACQYYDNGYIFRYRLIIVCIIE